MSQSGGFITSEPKGTHPRSEIADIPPHPVPLWITWGVWILTIHLNYVASYTDPLLFIFEPTYNYYVDNQGLVPWSCAVPSHGRVQSSFGLIGEGPE